MMRTQFGRSIQAVMAGMIVTIVAVKFRDHGMSEFDAWNVMGLLGAAGLFISSVSS